MKLKEKWNSLPYKKKNIYYWLGLILAVNLGLIFHQAAGFLQTGLCRNYMVFGSQMQPCTWMEFARHLHGWLAFIDLFALLPAAAIMIFASQIFDVIFSKPKE